MEFEEEIIPNFDDFLGICDSPLGKKSSKEVYNCA
jgi:hypothetical protein